MAAAIVVENLSKRYRLPTSGEERLPYRTLRDDLVRWATWPARWLRGQTGAAEEFWALKDVSFEVQPGEVVGIIGRNGAGKSTLLKVLSRITRPTAGRVRLRGRVGSLLEVGTGFHPELTGRENIYLSGAVLGMRRAEIRRKFDEIVAFAEVEKFLDLPVKRYSSGMYMRLAFAVAAHLDPEILLVDEVLAVGDAAFQKKCLGRMDEVARSGRTVLFVTHNMGAAQLICTRGVLLAYGQIHYVSCNIKDVIAEYGQQCSDEGASSRWTNTSSESTNPWFTPSELYVGNETGAPLPMPLAGNDDAWVYIKGRLAQLDPSLIIGIACYSQQGVCLFYSYHLDGPEEQWPTLKPGDVALRVRLPKRFFNQGRYRFEMIAGLYAREWILKPGSTIPNIFLDIQGGLSDSPLWTLPRDGEIGPELQWQHALPYGR